MKTKVYPVDEKHPAYWPTGPLIRFLRTEKAVRCVACGKKTKKHWTMLCPFRAVIFGECTFEIKVERFPVQRPGTAVCDDHPLHPELPAALIGCGEGVLPERDAPRIVCLCGSTRFSEAFQAANLSETLAGNIVLSIGCDMKSDAALGLPEDTKSKLDELHLRKIDLADEVLILNVGGYIGESTARELAYARERGKAVRFLEPQPGGGGDRR